MFKLIILISCLFCIYGIKEIPQEKLSKYKYPVFGLIIVAAIFAVSSIYAGRYVTVNVLYILSLCISSIIYILRLYSSKIERK